MVNSSPPERLLRDPQSSPDTSGELAVPTSRRSCIYEGTVVHWRRGSVTHAFQRRMYLLYLDLAELPQVLEWGRICSASKRALARFDRRDHLGDPDMPLDEAVRHLVERETGRRPSGRIAVLTQLRHFGIGFNPISVYYCFAPDDSGLETLVAEVSNTPWLQMHPYVLPIPAGNRRRTHRLANDKTFHVSPFIEMDYTYRWRVSEPSDNLLLHIENWRGEERCFGASFRAHRRALDHRTLARMLLRYPVVSAQVIAGIYFEAFRLWRKGATFQPHPQWSSGELPEPTPSNSSR